MKISWKDDVGAPLVVTAVDLITETAAPQYNEAVSYVAAAGSYAAAAMGYGGDFVLKMGIAAFPWAAKKLYTRVKTMAKGGTSSVAAVRRYAPVSRYPAPPFSNEFSGVKLD